MSSAFELPQYDATPLNLSKHPQRLYSSPCASYLRRSCGTENQGLPCFSTPYTTYGFVRSNSIFTPGPGRPGHADLRYKEHASASHFPSSHSTFTFHTSSQAASKAPAIPAISPSSPHIPLQVGPALVPQPPNRQEWKRTLFITECLQPLQDLSQDTLGSAFHGKERQLRPHVSDSVIPNRSNRRGPQDRGPLVQHVHTSDTPVQLRPSAGRKSCLRPPSRRRMSGDQRQVDIAWGEV